MHTLSKYPEVPVFFGAQLEMLRTHSPVTLRKTRVVYACGINTYKVATVTFNSKGNSLTFEETGKIVFCLFLKFPWGPWNCRGDFKASPRLLGRGPASGSGLAVENPRVDLGISWFGKGVEIITIIILLCRSCPSLSFFSH